MAVPALDAPIPTVCEMAGTETQQQWDGSITPGRIHLEDAHYRPDGMEISTW